MNKKGFIARVAAGAAGGALLIGGASAAIAAEVQDAEVDVNVTIDALPEVGALTMTVADDAATLTEVDSEDDTIRQFNGTLPTVTVTDDRENVPEGVFWYVTGQSSAFAGPAGASLPAGHLGWSPQLLTEGEEGDEVATGPDVDTVLDEGPNNVGLVGQEFLALSSTSQAAATVGSWDANAALFLKTPVDVTPGAYAGTITLTLWEDAE